MQPCDVLLHESGAPPIHTPLEVLLDLPEEVKNRLYVVHTAALPDDCGLRVAPTGTAGTIRLDKPSHSKFESKSTKKGKNLLQRPYDAFKKRITRMHPEYIEYRKNTNNHLDADFCNYLDDAGGRSSPSVHGDYFLPIIPGGCFNCESKSGDTKEKKIQPLVLLRPTCVSDAWFILNLLSAVPFLSR